MSQTLADFIDAAWNDHAADPQAVAARLPEARGLIEREPDQVGDFLGLAEHLLLGHLADPDAMEPWLAMAEPLVAHRPDAMPALARARLATRLLRGDEPQSAHEAVTLRVRACGTAVNGLAARGEIARARRLLEHAASLARADGGSDAVKALAAAFNNLASQLLDGARGPDADALMLEAAQASRETWAEVGTWINVERGEYVLALCAAAVGDGARAVGHACACLDLCAANEADAFETCFGQEALARGLLAAGEHDAAAAALQAMRALLPRIEDEGNRAFAQSSLDKLQAVVNPA